MEFYPGELMEPVALLREQYLYGILDSGYADELHYEETVCSLAEGGVRIIQFRAKDKTDSYVNSWCHRLAPLCRELGVLFIVNDYPHIALECGAAGVHIGQDDGDIGNVKKLVGREMLVGRSTHSYDQALKAFHEGADYIGFGPLFPTATKPGRPAIGMEDIGKVHQALPEDFPVYCIGGIHPDNLDAVTKAGARRVVIVSWLLKQQNISEAAQGIITCLKNGSLAK